MNNDKLRLRKQLNIIKCYYEVVRTLCAGFAVAGIVKQLFSIQPTFDVANWATYGFVLLFGIGSLLLSERLAIYEHELEQ